MTRSPEPVETAPDPARARARRLAWLLDNSIELPGGFRIGLDGIIGLVPGIGDAVAAGLSSYIVVEAARMGVPVSGLLRMLLNVAIELIVGVIPIAGDLFDFVFKANQRNVELMESYLDRPERARTEGRLVVAGVVLALVVLIVGAIYAISYLAGLAWAAATVR